jgi:hypothetical protein
MLCCHDPGLHVIDGELHSVLDRIKFEISAYGQELDSPVGDQDRLGFSLPAFGVKVIMNRAKAHQPGLSLDWEVYEDVEVLGCKRFEVERCAAAARPMAYFPITPSVCI